MNNVDEHLGDLAIVFGLAFAIIAPLSWVYIKLTGAYKMFKIQYRTYAQPSELKTTPPLDHEQKMIFKKGLQECVKEGIVISTSIDIVKE